MERWIFVLWISLFAGIVIARDCPASDNESVLQPQHEYWYRFKTEAFGEAVGTTNDRSRMIIECSVHIMHAHDCFYQLKLKDCMLSAAGGPSDSETAWINAKEMPELSRFPVMFTLGNGEIKHVYADEKDPLFYVNIKRGALSSFVFKVSSTKYKINESHVDIHGTCPWHSNPGNDGHVKAYKDMNDCAFPSRPDWQFSPWSMFWNMSFIQYQINSTLDCEYKIDMESQTLEKLYCKERHALGLESTHQTTTAVQTNIYYHMTLEKAARMKSAEKISKKSLPTRHTNILFEYEQTPDPSKTSLPYNFLNQAERMLSNLVETSEEGIQLLTIPKFTNFVAWLRTSHDLLPFIEKVQNCLFLRNHLTCTVNIKELAMSYLSDALVQCNTVPCFQAVSHLAVNNQLSDPYLNFVLYSWNNMHFTKPALISHVKKICAAKDSRFCWLVLGTMVQNYRERNPYSEVAKEPEEVASHFYNNIRPYCDEDTEMDEKHYYQLMTNFKAVANIGAVYSKYVPHGVQQLLSCGIKESLPMSIRITAMEVLQNLNVCQNPSTCDLMYKTLKPVFTNSSVDVGLRIAIYQQLILTPDVYDLKNNLFHLLQVEKNNQVLSYVASDLSNRLSDSEFIRDHKAFCHALTSLLKSHEISLHTLQSHRDEKSKSTTYGDFFKVPFLPADVQGFGLKYELSSIFPFYNMIPQSLRTNVTLKLFSKVITFFQAGGSVEGLYALRPLIERIGKEIHGRPLSLELFTHILATVEHFIMSEKMGPLSNVHYPFNKDIVDNIQRIHNIFQQHRTASKPSFSLFFGMFGSTLNMLTSGDLKSFLSMKNQIPLLLDKLKQGITYNQTRVIRIIEGYHQIPTMMGLPMNWTTNATLVFSSRKGLKLSFQKQGSQLDLHGNGFFQPSIALTFLNRMVLDFPTITQIGVQANSSGFSSTQWKARLDYSDANNQRLFVIEAPQKTQNLLELYRTNQLIKHNSYDDIPDWDIQRTSASWCSSKQFSSVLGLEICHERSYPNVTHLIKPWALMAGSCKWILQARLYDKNMKSYNFNLEKTENDLQRETNLIFDAPSSNYKRAIILKVSRSLNSEDVTATIKIEELPEFSLVLSNILLHCIKGREKGHRTLFEVKLADNLKYNLLYNSENNILKITEGTTDKNKSPKSKNLITLAQETALTLETPYNVYKYNRKMHFQDRNIKADISLSYENYHSEWNWLPRFLPPTLWDTSKKVWLRLRFNLRGHSPRAVICNIDTPKSSVQLTSSSLTMPGRDQLNINLTKVDASNKLLNFANFTYDLWTSVSDASYLKQVEILNFTIPQRSWSLQTKSIMENSKLIYDVVFTQAQMKPKSDIDENEYVDWWSDEMKELFDLSHQELKFKADIDSRIVQSPELLRKVPSLREEDIFNLNNRYILANISVVYPSSYQEESVNFDGSFIISHSKDVFRFQKDFALLSSFNKLRLDSHSVYNSEGSNKLLSHKSCFTHITSKTKAFYDLHYKQIHHETDCYDIDFNHNISSHVLDFTSNFNYHCDVANPERKTFILNLDSSSTMWDKLNTRLRQKIDGTENESFETVNFMHPLLNIDVTADWHGNRHSKKAIFTRTSDKMPVLILNLKSTIPWTAELVLEIPNEHGDANKIIYERKIMDNFRWFQVDVHFPDEQHEALKFEGQILDPNKRVWMVETFPRTPDLWNFFKDISRKLSTIVTSIARDPNHPFNQFLKPALKVPLSQYLRVMKREIQVNTYYCWNSIKSIIEIFKPIYETPVYITTQLSTAGISQIKRIYSLLEQKSIAVWSIKYFKLPELFRQGLINLSQGFHSLRNMLLPNSEERKFVYHGSPSLYWKSYKQLPVLASFSSHNNQQYPRSHNHRFAESKVGMIFGPRHVYTFDRLLYEFSNYPSENCVFLLAHDVHQSTFSILATFSAIHLLFPETAVTLSSEGRIYFNGSKTEQSLPFQSTNRNVFVKREGKILKISSPAVTVLCDTSNELCTLELNAWNGGGTIGLLGNADGESYNEYTMPNGSITNDLIELGLSYELSGYSQCQDLKLPERPAYVPEHGARCRQGLKVVCDSYENSKKFFFSSCLTNLKDCENGCPSITALAALCYFDNELMPTKCNVPQQESKNVRHRLEVVLLVNEHISMMGDKGMFAKGLESVVTAIDKQFQSNGYANILYSVLGFGGAGVHFHPSVHAVDNNIWVSHKTAIDLLKTLNFKGTVNADPISALCYAIEVLGYDTFDTKVIIVFTNEDPQEMKKSTLHLVQNYLENNSITLYALAFYPTIEKGKKVFGVRADGLMFPSPSKDAEAYLDYPRGGLAKLVSGTKGSLFLKHFVQQNGPPDFFTELAQEIWAKVRKEVNFCRSCKSIRSGRWYFYNECVLTNCNIKDNL